MKKALLITLYFISMYSVAQTLYQDDKGVSVFYSIKQTEAFTFCQGSDVSDEKINIWKVTLNIENTSSETIVPRGVGIANISVSSNSASFQKYCRYKQVKGYELNSGNLGRSLFNWSIRNYKVAEIKPGEVVTNIAYLYLYESQTPKLTNWEFLGYRLQKDFMPQTYTAIKKKEARKKVVSKKPISIVENKIEESRLKGVKKNITAIVVVESKKKKPIVMASTDALDLIPNQKGKSKMKTELTIISNSSEKKALAYKEKSNTSSNVDDQRAYSWLALYYNYMDECETGSSRSDYLPILINNVVDSYLSNTNGDYGQISKVKKCEISTKNQ